jgi:hypothetical protein
MYPQLAAKLHMGRGSSWTSVFDISYSPVVELKVNAKPIGDIMQKVADTMKVAADGAWLAQSNLECRQGLVLTTPLPPMKITHTKYQLPSIPIFIPAGPIPLIVTFTIAVEFGKKDSSLN